MLAFLLATALRLAPIASDAPSLLALWFRPVGAQPVTPEAYLYWDLMRNLQPHAVTLPTRTDIRLRTAEKQVHGTCTDLRGTYSCRIDAPGRVLRPRLPPSGVMRTWASWLTRGTDGSVRTVIARSDDGAPAADRAIEMLGAWTIERVESESVVLRAAATPQDRPGESLIVLLSSEDLFPVFEGAATLNSGSRDAEPAYAFDSQHLILYAFSRRPGVDTVLVSRFWLRTGSPLGVRVEVRDRTAQALLGLLDPL